MSTTVFSLNLHPQVVILIRSKEQSSNSAVGLCSKSHDKPQKRGPIPLFAISRPESLYILSFGLGQLLGPERREGLRMKLVNKVCYGWWVVATF